MAFAACVEEIMSLQVFRPKAVVLHTSELARSKCITCIPIDMQ